MKEIKGLIETQDEYTKMIFFAVFAMIVITFAVHYFTERLRFPKYIPGLISFVVGMVMLARLIPNLYDKSYLGDIVIACVAIGTGFIGLVFGLIIGVVFKGRYKPTYQEEDEIEYEEY